MMKTILIAVDGSNHARRALATGADLASGLGATLVLATVDDQGPLKGAVAEFAATEDLSRQQVVEWILTSATTVAEQAGAGRIETDYALGDPAGGVIELAAKHDADMIVLGARGLSDLQGLVLGSVSHKVMNLTKLPCLIVRE